MSRRLRLKRNELELPALLAVHGTDETGELDGGYCARGLLRCTSHTLSVSI